MYATASEAMEGLRHRRTKEILPSRTVARNTKLVYLDEDLVALEFHNTFIAKYLRDHVVIDTRDRREPKGWFTVTTWNRIDQFTPARTATENGLRRIVIDPAAGWDSTRLFEHGAIVSPDGSCEIPNLTAEQSDGIIAAKKKVPPKSKRFAKNAVKAWREWGDPLPCCEETFSNHANSAGMWEHYFEHFRANEVAVHPSMEILVNDQRMQRAGLDPDLLTHELERKLAHAFTEQFLPLAIERIAPNFPYPQIAPRRR